MNYYEQFYDDLEFEEEDDTFSSNKPGGKPGNRGKPGNHGNKSREPDMDDDEDWSHRDQFYKPQGSSRGREKRELDRGRPSQDFERGSSPPKKKFIRVTPPRDSSRDSPPVLIEFHSAALDRVSPPRFGEFDDEFEDRSKGPWEHGSQNMGQEEFRGRGGWDRGRGFVDQGRGFGDRGRGFVDRGRGFEDRGRGFGDRGRGFGDRGRGFFGDRGRGFGDRGRGGRGFGDRGRGFGDRGRGNFGRGGRRGMRRGGLEMNFVKPKEHPQFVTEGQPGGVHLPGQPPPGAGAGPSAPVGADGTAPAPVLAGYGYGEGSGFEEFGGPGGASTGPAPIQTTGPGVPGETPIPAPETSTAPTTAAAQNTQQSKVVTAVVKPMCSFVKSHGEFKSTDVAFHEAGAGKAPVPGQPIKPAIVAPSTPKTQLQLFDVAAAFKARANKDGRNPIFDAKFNRLSECVKVCSLPQKNSIEIIHMGTDKAKMKITDINKPGGRNRHGQVMFSCRLEIDGVSVAEGSACNKKSAKHEAYTKGKALLEKGSLTVVENPDGTYKVMTKADAPPPSTAPPGAGGSGVPPGTPAPGGAVAGKSASTTGGPPTGPPGTNPGYNKPQIVFHQANQTANKPLQFGGGKPGGGPPQQQPGPQSHFGNKPGGPQQSGPQFGANRPGGPQPSGPQSHFGGKPGGPLQSGPQFGANKPGGSQQQQSTAAAGELAMKLLNFVKEGVENETNTQKVTPSKPQEFKRPAPSKFTTPAGNKRLSQDGKSVLKRALDSAAAGNLRASAKKKSKNIGPLSLDDLSQFVVIDNSVMFPNLSDISILHASANHNKVVLKFEYEGCKEGYNCSTVLGVHCVATAQGKSKEEAKNESAKEALNHLKEICYTVLVKQEVDNESEGLTKGELVKSDKSNQVIPDSNVGNMLLRKMGWVGGGVGKDGKGRAEPVKTEMVIGREGLGLKAEQGVGKDFNKHVTDMLQNYIKSDDQRDLHFSAELAKEERAIIHQIGQKLGLKTQSKGKGDNRYLIVSRKRSANQLLEHIISSGGTTSKYEVVRPKNPNVDPRRREAINYGHSKQ